MQKSQESIDEHHDHLRNNQWATEALKSVPGYQASPEDIHRLDKHREDNARRISEHEKNLQTYQRELDNHKVGLFFPFC
jgi:hypothetical protein